jgi:hypothetical protein
MKLFVVFLIVVLVAAGAIIFSRFNRKSLESQPPMRRFSQESISLLAPSSWKQNSSPKFFSISAPNDAASITASAYTKEAGNLSEFAELRFSSVHDFYVQTSDEKKLSLGSRNIVMREYEGVWPGETKPTYYVVYCVETEGVYISLAIVTTREEFALNRKSYEDIIASVKISN